jgi:hypothetical protein
MRMSERREEELIMRLIGGRDYYDGMAFRSDGTVLSMLVYRRDGGRRETRPWMEDRLSIPRRRLSLRLHAIDGGSGPRRPRTNLFGSPGAIAHVLWNGADLRIDEGAVLFCGSARRCLLVRTEHRYEDGRIVIEHDWCWTPDEIEISLSSRGLGIDVGWDRSWFDPIPVHGEARSEGICIATLDPSGREGSRTSWRIDAPSLADMYFEQIMPRREALTRIADWVGGTPVNRTRTRLRVVTHDDRVAQGVRSR